MSVRLVRTRHRAEPFARQLFLVPPKNPLGEVRVKVTIANASDAVLADEGRLPEDQVRWCEVDTLVDRDVIEEALIFGDEVLLGQTVLERTDLLVDCANNRLVANPAHPDGPVYRVSFHGGAVAPATMPSCFRPII